MTAILKAIRPLGFHWQTQDPFLFCAHHLDVFPEGKPDMSPLTGLNGRQIGQDFSGQDGWSMYHGSKVPGFPAHPHKGFETVTIVEEGLVDHSDSLGAAGRFGNGDTQWMTAGKGVMHSEMFPLLNEQNKNPLHLFQIWLNLPQAKKNVPAHFKMMWKEDIPVKIVKDEQGKTSHFKLIAGQFGALKALAPAPDSYAADPANEVAIWLISAEAGARFTLPEVGEGTNRSLFFYAGDHIETAGESISEEHSIDLAGGKALEIHNGNKTGYFLYLQGKPLGEKVVQHGPFVMNSNQEIQEAVYEFQRTQFGGWPWESHEHTHPKERGRFAIHADGREETK
ncbi:pirin family protein [Cyclobacterium jeungdonense]|uniref:Pirin family protein n=1 Tax=Cyclobacterium jeungdonense TaxID=708087 RepID=A0ABT8C7K1_9BACT|nr:pirin family protein [Cyclobacterium jeungdonense]MDN3688490.1 pirin family protein [Cyclobacterium jeungdonense]